MLALELLKYVLTNIKFDIWYLFLKFDIFSRFFFIRKYFCPFHNGQSPSYLGDLWVISSLLLVFKCFPRDWKIPHDVSPTEVSRSWLPPSTVVIAHEIACLRETVLWLGTKNKRFSSSWWALQLFGNLLDWRFIKVNKIILIVDAFVSKLVERGGRNTKLIGILKETQMKTKASQSRHCNLPLKKRCKSRLTLNISFT